MHPGVGGKLVEAAQFSGVIVQAGDCTAIDLLEDFQFFVFFHPCNEKVGDVEVQAVCLFLHQVPVIKTGPAGGSSAGVNVVQDFIAGIGQVGTDGVSALDFEREGIWQYDFFALPGFYQCGNFPFSGIAGEQEHQ